jgi:hypothetical protein
MLEMKRRYVLILFLILLTGGRTPGVARATGDAAPAPPPMSERSWSWISTRDGLAPGAVLSLATAEDGATLIGTTGGASIWEGERLLSYGAGSGLAEGYIGALAATENARWVGSWGGGISVLRDGRWTRYRADSSSLPGDWISALAVDDDDALWVATYGRGLARLKDDIWTVYRRDDSPLPSDWLTALLPDNGGLWIGTERAGLAYLGADGRWQYYDLPFPTTTEVTALIRQVDELWAGTPLGVAVLHPATGRWRTITPEQGLPASRVTALAAGRDGGVWIGTYNGLALWREEQIIPIPHAGDRPLHAISALAVDRDGRLWAGVPGAGVAVSAALNLPEIERLPVVLVHGWHGPDSDRLEDSEFWHIARWLREDGFTPYYATGISPDNTLHRNAQRLREVIEEARQETGAPAVYLVGFSMGGLNSRAYIESTLYQGDVRHAFFLGTPHRGEHLWQTLLLWERLAWTDEPSALELLPIHAALFNRVHRNPYRVPYTLIAGDAHEEPLPLLFRELPPGDGLVSVWSAMGLDDLPGEHRLTGDLHAWGGDITLLGVDSLLHPRRTYDALIRPHLFGMGEMPTEIDEFGPYAPPEIDPRTALRSGSILPGETVTLPPIHLEAEERAGIYLRWHGEPPEFGLLDPTGRFIDTDRADDLDDVEFFELDMAGFAAYTLTDPLPGPWRIVLTADDAESGPTDYVAYASVPSPVRLRPVTDREWYHTGDLVTIAATLDHADADEVTVEIHRPDGLRESLTLERTTGADGALFLGQHRLPNQEGYYGLLFRATGERDGYVFERGAEKVIGVAGDGARLAGPTVLKTDGELTAEVGVTVRRAGHYLAAVTLLDARGQEVTTIAHPTQWLPGEKTVRIPIDTTALAGSSGPYHAGEVLLIDIHGAGLLLDRAP